MPDKNLEQEVENKESKSLIAKAGGLFYNVAVAAATTALGVATAGAIAPIVGASLAAGSIIGNILNGENSLYDTIIGALRAYSVINAVISPVILFGEMTYPLISNADMFGKVARTLYAMTAHHAFFTTAYRTTEHLIENYCNPSGLTKSLTKNYLYDHARTSLAFSPGWALTSNGISDLVLAGYSLPIFALNAFPVGMINSLYPIGAQKKQLQPQPVPQLRPAPS